jgi:hypothetical protein
MSLEGMSLEGTSGGPLGGRDVPPELLAQWQAAEERLYPVVLVSPHDYERAVRIVGELTADMEGTCPDMGALIDEAPRLAERAGELANAGGGSSAGLDLPLIAAAACALRHRQLANEAGRLQRIDRIARARASEDEWVVVEQGGPPTTWPPLPSTTIEMHLASGRALVETIEMDGETGARLFLLGELFLDRRTGQPLRPGPALDDEAHFDDVDAWHAAISDRRRAVGRLGPPIDKRAAD